MKKQYKHSLTNMFISADLQVFKGKTKNVLLKTFTSWIMNASCTLNFRPLYKTNINFSNSNTWKIQLLTTIFLWIKEKLKKQAKIHTPETYRYFFYTLHGMRCTISDMFQIEKNYFALSFHQMLKISRHFPYKLVQHFFFKAESNISK